jgi:hypothetical protein
MRSIGRSSNCSHLLSDMTKTVALGVAVSLICVAGLLADSTTANWGAQIFNGVGTADGTPLPNGSNDLILLGSFDFNNSQIIANGSNEPFLASHFTTFATAVIGQGDPNGSGSASDGYWTAVDNNSASLLSLQNKEIFYWVFNAATAGAATQYGIFTNPSLSSWTFPDDTSVAQVSTTDLSQVPPDISGILWGSYNTGVSRDGSSPLYNLEAVPETSTLFCGALCAAFIALHALRRRRSRG